MLNKKILNSFLERKSFIKPDEREVFVSTRLSEQRINPSDHKLKSELDAEIRERINDNTQTKAVLSKESWSQEDSEVITRFIEGYLEEKKMFFVEKEDKRRFISDIINDIFGLGMIEELRKDPKVTEIWVLGKDNIFYEKGGKRIKADFTFRDDNSVKNLINKILAPINRKIDETEPIVDARLEDGSRVAATIWPISLSGPSLNIRKFKTETFDLNDYIRVGSLTKEMAEFLSLCVKGKLNILVVGSTGSGKTTLLNALSHEIPMDCGLEHIVTIEDTAELQIGQPFKSVWETKKANSEGVGGVSPTALLRHSLRNAPDRIIIGEIRDAIAYEVLQAANTGHEGTMTTIHADSSKMGVDRFASLASESRIISREEAEQNFSEKFDIIIFVKKLDREMVTDGSEVRKVIQITYVGGYGKIGASKIGINMNSAQADRSYVKDVFFYDIEKGRFESSGFYPKELDAKIREKGYTFPPVIFKKGVLQHARKDD